MIAAGTRPPRVIATMAVNGAGGGEPPGERAGVAMELVPGNRKGLCRSSCALMRRRLLAIRGAPAGRGASQLRAGSRRPEASRIIASTARRASATARRVLAAHDDLVAEPAVAEGRIGADRDARGRASATSPSAVAVGALGQAAGLDRSATTIIAPPRSALRRVVEHRLHDARHAGHDDDVADAEARRLGDGVLDELGAVRECAPCAGAPASGPRA